MTVMYENYQQWEDAQSISSVSPEAYLAEEAWLAAIAMKNAVLPMVSAPTDGKHFIGLIKENNKINQVICWNGGGDWLCNTTQGEDICFPFGWQRMPEIPENI